MHPITSIVQRGWLNDILLWRRIDLLLTVNWPFADGELTFSELGFWKLTFWLFRVSSSGSSGKVTSYIFEIANEIGDHEFAKKSEREIVNSKSGLMFQLRSDFHFLLRQAPPWAPSSEFCARISTEHCSGRPQALPFEGHRLVPSGASRNWQQTAHHIPRGCGTSLINPSYKPFRLTKSYTDPFNTEFHLHQQQTSCFCLRSRPLSNYFLVKQMHSLCMSRSRRR